ncbi:hypothetical protein PV379_03780 [Streptomyces caniscabiei]|uniref:hypothetical protein n=1 Tax=Streptomyces caniscabiei TaxID=2746961 RepID=UPI0029BF62A5|nr:hypothetical protein [Streptomyces caniscabiei]MDX2776460.1 hypothetical protein [Streptomyces caniscabiei]
MKFAHYRIFIITVIITAAIIATKYLLHSFGLELIVLGSLHGSVISGVIFVIGFILSATISDYKEAERIPAEIASTIEDMNEDVISIYQSYPEFDLTGYQKQLKKVAKSLAGDLRSSKSDAAKTELYALGRLHADMEKSGVPANFIVKLKQQQASLTRHLFRVNYIQKITFIPSSIILAWSIVIIAVALLVFTEVEPFVGGVVITGAISFIMVYVLQLITVIKTPYHDEGKTKDDVSLFLIDRTIDHLESEK